MVKQFNREYVKNSKNIHINFSIISHFLLLCLLLLLSIDVVQVRQIIEWFFHCLNLVNLRRLFFMLYIDLVSCILGFRSLTGTRTWKLSWNWSWIPFRFWVRFLTFFLFWALSPFRPFGSFSLSLSFFLLFLSLSLSLFLSLLWSLSLCLSHFSWFFSLAFLCLFLSSLSPLFSW